LGKTLNQFSIDFTLAALQITENIDEGVRKVALAIDQAVVIATPVDTGRARSNWLVTVGSQSETDIPPYVPGSQGSTAGPNVQKALDQAKAAVAAYKGAGAIFITNNLPYIQRLDEGWSKQAPAGYVSRAAEAAAKAVGSLSILPTTL